jgi:hypothetical protein
MASAPDSSLGPLATINAAIQSRCTPFYGTKERSAMPLTNAVVPRLTKPIAIAARTRKQEFKD